MKKSNPNIPRLIEWLLQLLVNSHDRDSLRHAYSALYEFYKEEKGSLSASLWLMGEILLSAPGLITARIKWSLTMYRNYLKIALRNILRHKGYSILNLLGLMVGLAIFTLFCFNIGTATIADQFHKNADRIYSIVQQFDEIDGQDERSTAFNPSMTLPTILDSYSGIEKGVRVFRGDKSTLKSEKDTFYETSLIYADREFFDIFSFELISGVRENLLKTPNSVVISEETAIKYFGNKNPIGKTLLFNNKVTVTVTGIFKNHDGKTSLWFDLVFEMETAKYLEKYDENWSDNTMMSFLLIEENYPIDEFNNNFPEFIDTYMTDAKNKPSKMYLFPLLDFRLNAGDITSLMDSQFKLAMYVVFIIGLLLLVVVSINFVNLSTARYLDRIKEIGMRKIVGATRGQLISQFLGESMLMALISVPGAVVVYELIFVYLSSNYVMDVNLSTANSPFLLKYLIGGAVFTGFAAGLYPAFFVSAFTPMDTLKGKGYNGKGKSKIRTVLVIGQFAVSLMLIIATLHLNEQFKATFTIDFGYNNENVLVFEVEDITMEKVELLQSKLTQFSEVETVSATTYLPGNWTGRSKVYRPSDSIDKPLYLSAYGVDNDFLKTLKMEILVGEGLARGITNENSLVINELALEKLGWDNPIGKQLTINEKVGNIVGIVKDFHFRGVNSPRVPAVFYLKNNDLNYVIAKTIPGADNKKITDSIYDDWSTISSDLPFKGYTLRSDFNRRFENLLMTGFILLFAAIVTIFFSCVGLFGLVSYSVIQKTKEIGIRKVLGSSVGNLVWKLSKGFIIMSVISIVIALPTGYVFSQILIDSFSYPIEQSPLIFFGGVALMLATTALAVLTQTIKASNSNPVEALRYE